MAAPKGPNYREDLWVVATLPGGSAEENLDAWRQAACMLAGLEDMAEEQSNQAFFVAIADARERALEEVRRHEVEVEMRREWGLKHPSRAGGE
ncbi:MAG: hypothetical protein M3R38_20560 [Actinomycetota bacterium]|nr:hypothetical protein [Actinomycetota bacterium]